MKPKSEVWGQTDCTFCALVQQPVELQKRGWYGWIEDYKGYLMIPSNSLGDAWLQSYGPKRVKSAKIPCRHGERENGTFSLSRLSSGRYVLWGDNAQGQCISFPFFRISSCGFWDVSSNSLTHVFSRITLHNYTVPTDTIKILYHQKARSMSFLTIPNFKLYLKY